METFLDRVKKINLIKRLERLEFSESGWNHFFAGSVTGPPSRVGIKFLFRRILKDRTSLYGENVLEVG